MLLDALGTVLDLEPPAPRLQAALAARGVQVDGAAASTAIKAEIAYYRAHLGDGRDAAGLAGLRRRCAGVLGRALPAEAAGLGDAVLLDVLLEAIRFRAYPEAPAALAALRDAGWTLVVASNWDVSLHQALRDTGLDRLVDAAVSSAEIGAAKPERAVFAAALALARADAATAVHVGDSVLADVHGALAAGIEPVLLARAGAELDGPVPDGTRVLPDLAAVAAAYA